MKNDSKKVCKRRQTAIASRWGSESKKKRSKGISARRGLAPKGEDGQGRMGGMFRGREKGSVLEKRLREEEIRR